MSACSKTMRKAASALNHPNILTIHEIGEADGAHYIVSEFVEGETLRELMRRGALSLTAALDVARQVAGALAAAHAAGCSGARRPAVDCAAGRPGPWSCGTRWWNGC